jgi:NitT/TauT family transport system substrate-binding protein
MPITLQENLRGILYTPFYAALALGAYRREGVEVGFVSAPEPARAVEGLFAGTVDVAWGGPMRVMQTYDRRADCDLVCFGEAVTRDPFFLIGREPRPDFAFADLYGKRVATVSEVPTPWLCLQEDLRRARPRPRRITANGQSYDGHIAWAPERFIWRVRVQLAAAPISVPRRETDRGRLGRPVS